MEEYKTKIKEMKTAGVDENMIGEYTYYLYTSGKIDREQYTELSRI